MSSKKEIVGGPLLVGGVSDICGTVLNDIVVDMNCTLHVCGNVKGGLTIERGANVVVEGSVDGRVVNRGGRLAIHNRAIAKFAKVDGPPKAEVDSILKINLSAIASNWETLTKGSAVESAAVVKADAYGCGTDQVVTMLSEVGCKTFFVSSLAEARRVRAAAANSTIYVLNGLYPGTGPAFAALNARPVINSDAEMTEWEAFAVSSEWTGGFALNVDPEAGPFGFSLEDAVALAKRHSPRCSVTLIVRSRCSRNYADVWKIVPYRWRVRPAFQLAPKLIAISRFWMRRSMASIRRLTRAIQCCRWSNSGRASGRSAR
jgi:hypothetical protein